MLPNSAAAVNFVPTGVELTVFLAMLSVRVMSSQ